MSARLCQLRKLPVGKWHVAVLVRRAYSISPGQRPVPEQHAAEGDADEATGWKPFTDVIFRADVHARGGLARETVATFAVDGRIVRSVRATGVRLITGAAGGIPTIGEATPFDVVPMTFERCYGGFDRFAHERAAPGGPELVAELLGLADADASPFTYPRNARGTGYFVEELPREAIGTALPALDDPEDPLEPERIVRSSVEDWLDAPMPAALDWTDPSDFPRCALMGFPPMSRPAQRPLREISLGAVELRHMEEQVAFPPTLDPRCLQGAAPGLGSVRLAGGEHVRMTNVHATHREWIVEIPREAPHVSIRPPGCPDIEAGAELMSAVIDARTGRLTLTWSAMLEVAARYPDDEFAAFTFAVR